MRREHYILAGILLALVIYGGYLGAKKASPNADLTAPPEQPPPEDLDFLANLAFYCAPDGHRHLCPPADHHSGYVYTPHRYPRSIGGNITNAIHHGWSMMRVPNVEDVQWIISPPSEVAW